MKIAPVILLTCCLGIAAALGWASVTAESTAGLAKEHAVHAAMQTSGGMQRDFGVWPQGVAVGVFTLIAAGVCFSMGVKRIAVRDIAIATVLSLIAFVGMMVAYRGYAATDTHVVSGWFPSPTNWQFFGLGLLQAAFVVVWVVGFRRWVFSTADQAKFDGLMERSRVDASGEVGE